ncbi:hypothetical protein OIU77_008683 [Salix suchowensis]|uniref:Uncharacterized protein n=1 Tax=Salix suchowensis TaxID=1278906 RepID=A0ABQ9ABS2_9ROSI|nr:hypothetical protein OIU77_008683 [Salix suchowensis]
MAWNSLPNLRTWLKHSAWYAKSSSLNQLEIGTFLKWLLGDVNKDECSRVRQAVRLNFRQIIWSLSSDEFVEKHTWSLFDFPQTELHAYFLIQAPETKAIGDSLGFGSSFLFSSALSLMPVILDLEFDPSDNAVPLHAKIWISYMTVNSDLTDPGQKGSCP